MFNLSLTQYQNTSLSNHPKLKSILKKSFSLILIIGMIKKCICQGIQTFTELHPIIHFRMTLVCYDQWPGGGGEQFPLKFLNLPNLTDIPRMLTGQFTVHSRQKLMTFLRILSSLPLLKLM